MSKGQKIIEQLYIFKARDKFSEIAWRERGLNPSDEQKCQKLSYLFNESADLLIESVKLRHESKQITAILNKCLSRFKSEEYDTEEKEFICDLFFELSAITNVDLKDEIIRWLYGDELASMSEVKEKKILKTYNQKCSNCGSNLESFVMQEEPGAMEVDWLIVSCNACKELNVINVGSGIKELKFGNYKVVRSLRKDEYSLEEVQKKLEQLKVSKLN